MTTPRLAPFKRVTSASLTLGLATLFTNILVYLISPNLMIPIGNVFLFWGAAALGITGSLVVFAIGVAPEVVASGDWIYGCRILMLSLGIALTAKKFPLVPGFMIATGLWAFLFTPALIFFAEQKLYNGYESYSAIMLAGLSEILLVIMSSAMLLHSGLLSSTSQRSRQISTYQFLLHALPLFSSLALVTCMAFLFDFSAVLENKSLHANLTTFASIILLAVFLPCLGAYGLATILKNNATDLFAANLVARSPDKHFSGLASQYWRRRSEAPARKKTKRIEHWDGVPEKSDNGFSTSDSSGVCALSKNGTVLFLNNRFKSLLGATQNNAVGKKIDQLSFAPRVKEHLLEVLERTSKSGPLTTELRLNELPEKLRYFEISSRFSNEAEDGQGLEEEIILTARDITSLRTVESHLLKAQKLGSLGGLVKNIAHSFNNTLTSIAGYTSYARRIDSKNELNSCLDKVLSAAHDAEKYVKQMLEFADDDLSTLPCTLDFDSLLRDHLGLFQNMVGQQHEIDFSTPRESIKITCDSKLVLQAISNLLVNAREAYGEEGGKISIHLDTEIIDEDVSYLHIGAQKGEYARLQVKDQGFGMSQEIVARSFDPLFTTKSEKGNAGLGLSIVFSIVRAHDGFLTVESHPGKGSNISLYFPVADEKIKVKTDPKSISDTEHIKEKLKGMKENILVVEDEESVRELVSMMLSTLNYSVESCSDGEKALEHCKNKKFDLVLVDMVMPGMNGQALLERMKHAGGQAKTLVMTGYGVLPGLQGDKDSKIISKPFDIETLGAAVKSALESDSEKAARQDSQI